MTLAAIDWLSISINLLLVVFVIVCLLMTLLILMQRPKQEGLGAAFGGGVTDQVFGARTTNVLQRGTVYCGTLFFVLALVLAILIGHQNKDSALLQGDKPAAEQPADDAADPDASTPDTPTKPDEGDGPASLLDELPEEDKEGDTPAEEGDAPAEEGDAPAEEGDAPAEQPEAPSEDSSEQGE